MTSELKQLTFEKRAPGVWKSKGLFSKGDVYFCFDFPIGADSVLFFYSSLLVYNVSAKGHTLAPFSPDTSEGKNKGKTWTWRSPGRPHITRKCAFCIYLSYIWFWILQDPQGLSLGRLRAHQGKVYMIQPLVGYFSWAPLRSPSWDLFCVADKHKWTFGDLALGWIPGIRWKFKRTRHQKRRTISLDGRHTFH